MRIISWNVNGLRACLKKNFAKSIHSLDADIICLQETKMERNQAEIDLPEHFLSRQFWNSSTVKKGYSGTAVFSKMQPIGHTFGIGIPEHSGEGRVITLEYKDWFLVNVYTPNAQDGLKRLEYRMRWEDDFREYLKNLDTVKPVIVCGDMNVAHQEIDLARPKDNRHNPGFTDEERNKMTELLSAGFADTFRVQHPDTVNAYTWWSYRSNARANNVGWRIDYFLVSLCLVPKVQETAIYPAIFGSDHCPVGIVI